MITKPEKLALLIETLQSVAEDERVQMLLDFADRFREVPALIATRPFPEENRVPFCESEAFVWSAEQPDGSLKFYFAVENPSGISAKALGYVLDRTLSGAPVEEVAEVPTGIVEEIFRQNISMGKGMGLMAMVQAVQRMAQQRLTSRG